MGANKGRILMTTACLVLALVAPVLPASPVAAAAAGSITTIAGGGVGNGGPATAAALLFPQAIAVDGAGNLFIADQDNFSVRKVTPGGIITAFAGNGVDAFAGDGGPAAQASFEHPTGVAVDALGRVYIADDVSYRVRRVDANGVVSTVAGNGDRNGPGPDGVPATSEGVFPDAVAVDRAGNLLLVDCFNQAVRRVDSNGIITTIAGGGSPADGLGDNGPATMAALANCPQGIVVDRAGDLIISDGGNQRIRKVDTLGIITTIAGDGNYNFSGDGGPAVNAEIEQPVGVAIDPTGGIDFADNSLRIRRIDPAGIITTIAGNGGFGTSGDGGPATAASMGNNPTGVAVDSAGNLFFAQAGGNRFDNRVRKVDTHGIITTFAGGGLGDGDPATSARLAGPVGVRATDVGVFIADTYDNRVRLVDNGGVMHTVAGGANPFGPLGDGGPATAAALERPQGIAVTPRGDTLFIADCGHGLVRRVGANGIIGTVAGGGSPADGVGDGGLATSAAFSCPTGLLMVPGTTSAAAPTLFVADCPANRVRRVGPDGMISTVAGTGDAGFNGDGKPATATLLSCPSDLALDPAGNLLIADSGNNRVRRIDANGQVSTVAGDGATGYGADGGQATATHVNGPTGLAVQADGGLLIAERAHARLRLVDTMGKITTVAGTGVPGFSGDGGPATAANVFWPTQVSVKRGGDIVFTDSGNDRVREVQRGTAPASGPHHCGEVITASTTLTHDIGPCPKGNDGIVLGADNITLNLNGHTISGPGAGAGTGSNVGVRLTQRHGDTVTGGTVTGFDAGVALVGSSGNAVTNMTINHNVAPLVTPNGFEGSEFGDGIAVLFSGNNRIDHNVIDANGVFDNIAVLGIGSNGNTISNNTVSNEVGDGLQGTSGIGNGIDISPFLDLTLPGRGGSLHGNNIVGNVVKDNYTDGISSQSNTNATISHNVVTGNGIHNPHPGNGIGVVHNARATPNLYDVIDSNETHGNAANGVVVTGAYNHITNNNAANNALLPSSNPYQGVYDLKDNDYDPVTFDPSCINNVWANNTWGPAGVFPPCVAGASPAPAAAPAHAVTASPPAGSAGTQDPMANNRHLGAADRSAAVQAAGGG